LQTEGGSEKIRTSLDGNRCLGHLATRHVRNFVMTSTIISALLPIVVTLMLGFAAGWHQDFDGRQADILNRMIMLYALPLNLFAGMIGTSRDEILGQWVLGTAILLGMVGTYAIVFVIARFLCGRDLMTSSLQALAIGGPAVPFVGVPILGQLVGAESAIPISVASLAMNLIQVPLTLMLLSVGTGSKKVSTGNNASTLASHLVHALRQPVVWAPVLALVLVLVKVEFPNPIRESLFLLGKATGGVSLFASGIVLFSRHVAVSLPTSISVCARNIIVPAATWALCMIAGVAPETTREIVLSIAIPTASICVILAVQYKVAEQEMASTLFFSTIFSVVTMGAFMWLTA
jgi:malonate transporter and related proteins